MLWVLILGLLMNLIVLPLAALRVLFLYRAITRGQPAPDRVKGVTGRMGTAIKRQVVEVFGQKKLLKWSVPGAAHFFVFWAFLILATVYLEAYGSLLKLLSPVARADGLGDPLIAALGRPRLPAGLHRGDGPGRPGHLRLHPAEERPEEPRPRVPVLRLPPGRGLAHALHDLQRHLDDVPVPRCLLSPRQPALRERRVRLDRAWATCWTASATAPWRSSRASACSCTSE